MANMQCTQWNVLFIKVGLESEMCTVCFVQYDLCNLQSVMWKVHIYAMCNLQCTMYNVQSVIYNVEGWAVWTTDPPIWPSQAAAAGGESTLVPKSDFHFSNPTTNEVMVIMSEKEEPKPNWYFHFSEPVFNKETMLGVEITRSQNGISISLFTGRGKVKQIAKAVEGSMIFTWNYMRLVLPPGHLTLSICSKCCCNKSGLRKAKIKIT